MTDELRKTALDVIFYNRYGMLGTEDEDIRRALLSIITTHRTKLLEAESIYWQITNKKEEVEV